MLLKKLLTFVMLVVSVSCFAMGPDFIFVQGNKLISDFYICDHEVTQAEYIAVIGTNPSEFKGDNNPVECVNWYEAINFCNKFSEKEGLTPCYSKNDKGYVFDRTANGYRLPTNTEWEWAAKGGVKSKGYKYYGSNNMLDVAWFSNNSGIKTHPVKQKQPNELGLYDMAGNVWEWCWDWFSSDNSKKSVKDYAGPDSGSHRIARGGSYDDGICTCVVADTNNMNPSFGFSPNGLRLVRNASDITK